METMKALINNLILEYQIVKDFNENPHENIAHILFEHMVYDNMKNLDQSFNYIRDLEKLKTESEKHFLDLFKTYFLDTPMVIVRGIPSLDEHHKLRKEEEKRIAEQIQLLGKQGLHQKQTELTKAIEGNKQPVPAQILAKMTIPLPNSITYHSINRYTTETTEQHRNLDVRKLPLFTYLDHVNTNVFYLQVIMDTSSISREYKTYIPIMFDAITNFSPMKKESQLMSYEELLFADSVTVRSYIEISGDIAHNVFLMLQTELHNYEKSVQWCKMFLYDIKVTSESLKLAISQALNDIDKLKVQGDMLVVTVMELLVYSNDSHKFTYNRLRQRKFLKNVQKRLNTDEEHEEVMAKIKFLRQTLISPKNMFLYMAVNVEKLTEQVLDVFAPWNKFFSECRSSEKTKMNIPSKVKHLTPSIRNTYNGCIIGLECIDKNSSYFYQTCPCINNYEHADLPALEVCLTYLKQEGGILWREIRELVQLDDFNVFTLIADGLLGLKFNSVSDVVAAYQTTKVLVKENVRLFENWENLLENAKSSTILNYISNLHSRRHMINTSLKCYCRNVKYNYVYSLIERIFVVTMADMRFALNKYVKTLFDLKQCKTVIVCNISEVAEIKTAFQEMEFNLNVYTSFEELNEHIENMTTKWL